MNNGNQLVPKNCPLAGTTHLESCALAPTLARLEQMGKAAGCTYRADCADMLADEKCNQGPSVPSTYRER